MFNKMKKIAFILFIIGLLASCNNLFENEIKKQEEPLAETTVSSNFTGDYYVSFNLQEAVSRTVLPEYSYTDCLFDLYGTRGDDTEVILLNKVSYNELISPKNVKVKTGTWTFTVDCFDENNKKILSGTSPAVNISTSSVTIQIPMTFIVGNDGCVEISLTFPKGTDIATVASVKAGLFNSPLAAADSSCSELTMTSDGDNYKVIFAKSNLESGLTKYVKFFIYSESGVELGRYTEAVIIGDNLTSKKDLTLTSLRAPNVLTLTLKTNGSTYTGEAKDSLVLKAFPNEEKSYPMSLNEGTTDTYSANIVNGVKYILYDGDYNTKLIYIPTATETSDGIVEYCDSFTDAANALTNDTVTKSGLGLIVKDNISTSIGDNSETAGETLFYNAARVRNQDLISLNLEDCVAVTGMPWYAICRYPMLVSISFPRNCKSLPDINNTYLAAIYINEGVERIDYDLRPTASLEYLSLPSTLKSIECSGLGNCLKLRNIIIADSNEYYSSDGQRIMSKDGKTLYSWPSANCDIELSEGINSIDSGTFCNNTRITSVKLPSTLEKIGSSVFSGCTTLRTVQIPEGVKSIDSGAFAGCSNIKSMTIPESVIAIGDSAFYGCKNIKTLIIPDNVTSIGYGAFSYCTQLKSINLPEGLISIEPATFNNCSSLETIDIPSTVKTLGRHFDPNDRNRDFYYEDSVFGNCSSLRTINLPDGLEEIGVYAFYNCNQLKNINLPAGLKQIDPYAFYYSGLITVTVPDNVEYIGEFAFSSNSQLKTVSIGSGVNRIEKAPFLGCSSITSLTVSSANSFYEAIDNSLYTKGKKEILYYLWNGETEIKIPEGVEKIGDCLFSNNQTITKVDLPSSLTSIGNSAFYYCKQLTEIIIPDNVTVIGASAFYECSNLKTVKLSSSLTQIESTAFRDCYALESIDLPSGLTTIGSYAFEGTKLKEIRIPGTVTSFGTGAFAWLGLETVYFEEGITYIGSWWIFWDLGKLTTVYLPKSVGTIYEKTFAGCNNITDVYYGGSESDWAKISKGSENGTLFTATRHYNADYYKSDDE